MKITALTSVCVDYFPEQDKVFVGGNSLNFATQCKLLGIENVSVVGAVGNDRFGNLIEQYLDNLIINRSHLYRTDWPTASNKIFINKEGDRYFKADSWNGGAFDVFRLSENDWDQISGSSLVAMPAGDPNLKELLKRRNKNQLVVIDFLDYFGVDSIKHCISDIDIVFLSGKDEMLDDLRELSSQSGKMIVATLGANGSVAFFQKKKYFHKAIEVDNIIDTTGCGDSFQAAFSIEWMNTKDVDKSLKAGSIAAGKVLGFMGGVEQSH
jgi:fructoselysine 6-kinase